MPATLATTVGRAAHQHHEHRCGQIRDGTHQADPGRVGDAAALDDRGQPEVDRIHPALDAEVHRAQHPHRRVAQHRAQRAGGAGRLAGFVVCQRAGQCLFLLRIQPGRLLHAIAEQEPYPDAQQHRGQALQQKHPLPAGKAALPGRKVAEDPARQRPAQHPGDRDGRHEDGHDPAMLGAREPARQVQHDAGEETGLGSAGEQAQRVKTGRGAHEHQAGGEQAPADHHDRHPAARADALQDQIARHPAGQVADEEDACAQPVHGLAHAQITQHLQLGEAHIDPVQVIEQVADEQEGDQPPQDLAVGRAHTVGGRQGPGGLGHRTLQQSVGPPVHSALAPAPHRGRRILVGAFSRKHRQDAACLWAAGR
ncbi:hypothetical protein XHC_4418 [Xanthomonas hortorum pv. carotae str. M081]|nr:hypothetical protein XHC_4418 [Xanthomonas hortorum pv. carotae str. M081]